MAHKGMSMSKSALLLSPCIRWACVGAKAYEDKYADTTKRDKGILFHVGMDEYYGGRVGETAGTKSWSDVDNWLLLAKEWSAKHLEPRAAELFSEMYVAYNFETGEHHCDDSIKDRNYPALPGFVPGTADIVCVLADGSLLVADWKTGGGTGADKQLLSLSLGLREHFRQADGSYRMVRLAILYVGDGGVHPVEWTVTDDELSAHRTAMQFQLVDVGVRSEPVPGIHCTQLYCPHLAYCPGITSVVDSAAEGKESLLPAASLLRRYSIQEAPSGPDHAGYIMERVTAAKRQLKFYEERIRKWAEAGNKVLAGDYEYSKGKDGFRWRAKK